MIREQQPYEYRILRPDRVVRWVLAHGEAIFEEVDGELRATRYVGTLQDITDRRRAEQERVDSEARLRLAIEAGGMAVWQVDLATDTIIGSPELNRLLGFPEGATPAADEMRARGSASIPTSPSGAPPKRRRPRARHGCGPWYWLRPSRSCCMRKTGRCWNSAASGPS